MTVTSPDRRLRVVPPPAEGRGRGAQQLTLIGLEPARATLISAPVNELHISNLSAFLQRYKPRHIVDIRISPSLRAIEFTDRSLDEHLRTFLVTYRTAPALANRFAGYSWDPQKMRRLYLEHLHAHITEIVQLREHIDHGPILLVSADERHEASDRSHVIEELNRIRPGFDIIIHE